MSKPELGTKRTCPETGKKFYDLGKDPIVSPYTGTTYPLSFFEASSTSSRGGRSSAREDDAEAETEVVEAADETTETVSLSDVEDDEDTSNKNASDVDVDEDDEANVDSGDDDTFLEEDEDEDDDMTDIIGSREDDDD